MVRRGRARWTAAVAATLLLFVGAAACGSDDSSDGRRAGSEDAGSGTGAGAPASVSACSDDAQPAPSPYGSGFPASWPFPPGTTVLRVEDGSGGTVATGVSTQGLHEVLRFMRTEVVAAGFETTADDAGEHDAGGSWRGKGFRGHWAVRDSSTCPGETVVQVVASRR